jgi:alanine racemase
MWQAEIQIDLTAIRDNVARLCAGTSAEVMSVVKADGYGHGMIPSARAAVAGGAAWLGVATIPEALTLRAARFDVPILAWLWTPGAPLAEAIGADVDLSVATRDQLDEMVAASRAAGRIARVHLKLDTGLNRGGSTVADWPALAEAAAKSQADGDIDVVAIWSHLADADGPSNEPTDRQLAVFEDGLAAAASYGLAPRLRHIANSAATLTRPDTHFEIVRAGLATYGLSPMPERKAEFGLRPAMTARARVLIAKRVPAGEGVSYGQTYRTATETTLAVVPMGYADGVPRHASSVGPVRVAGANRTIAGRVCMDQFVVDCGDDAVAAGDVVTLFGPGDDGEPTADDWAAAIDTINYEIVTRIGSGRVDRTYIELPEEPLPTTRTPENHTGPN